MNHESVLFFLKMKIKFILQHQKKIKIINIAKIIKKIFLNYLKFIYPSKKKS